MRAVLYDNTKQRTADIFYTTRKGNHSSFLTPTVVVGDAPFPLKFALTPLRKTATSTDFHVVR